MTNFRVLQSSLIQKFKGNGPFLPRTIFLSFNETSYVLKCFQSSCNTPVLKYNSYALIWAIKRNKKLKIESITQQIISKRPSNACFHFIRWKLWAQTKTVNRCNVFILSAKPKRQNYMHFLFLIKNLYYHKKIEKQKQK